ncbi:hypothetical protein JEQ12_002209 [Ovis aries]|uniref:Potassium channel tetramerisation-type BTB domain-containing protein n=1 Tax=Ovis aries TaxID=9940 RepID=A0A835ZXE2_SHEEP|nr:hypothetical protein JEQ12_002209 [Ovis aries]
MFTQQQPQELARDSKGRFFLDRDGFLFRYILDYLRDLQLVLPDYFPERSRLQREAEYFELPELVRRLGAPQQPGPGPPPPHSRRGVQKEGSLGDDLLPLGSAEPEQQEGASAGAPSPTLELASRSPSGGAAGPLLTPSQSLDGSRRSGYITIGYRGSYTIGRDAQADAKFRRVARITVSGTPTGPRSATPRAITSNSTSWSRPSTSCPSRASTWWRAVPRAPAPSPVAPTRARTRSGLATPSRVLEG